MVPIVPNQLALPNRHFAGNQTFKWPPQIKPGEKFIRGPLPLQWFEMAGQLPGKALCVALVIWYLAGLNKSRVVKLSSKILKGFGVDRYSKSRGLKSLEQVGLVSVERLPGRNPKVTILVH